MKSIKILIMTVIFLALMIPAIASAGTPTRVSPASAPTDSATIPFVNATVENAVAPKADKTYVDGLNGAAVIRIGAVEVNIGTHETAISGKLTKSSNLSDLTDNTTARSNLGLGSAAIKNTGTAAGNIPVLDANGKIEERTLPSVAITDTYTTGTTAEIIALPAHTGDVAIVENPRSSYILQYTPASTFSNWQLLKTPLGSVTSVNSQDGDVHLTKSDIGLSDVTNETQMTISHPANAITGFGSGSATTITRTDDPRFSTYDGHILNTTDAHGINAKADKSYVDSQDNAITAAVSLKADKSYVDDQDSAIRANLGTHETLINTKAATLFVTGLFSALYANLGTHEILINSKADKSYVDNNFGTTAAVDLKADKTYVDSQDGSLAANLGTHESLINTKADKTYVDGQDAAITAAVNLKADKTYVDNNFGTTADVALKADKTYVDGKDDALFANLGTLESYLKGSVENTLLNFIASFTGGNSGEVLTKTNTGWIWSVVSGGAGGATTFTQLTDAFQFTGNALKFVRVNNGATALEPIRMIIVHDKYAPFSKAQGSAESGKYRLFNFDYVYDTVLTHVSMRILRNGVECNYGSDFAINIWDDAGINKLQIEFNDDIGPAENIRAVFDIVDDYNNQLP